MVEKIPPGFGRLHLSARGTCRTRCQVHAIAEHDDVSIVDKKKCIGCGLCVTGCPNNAARLIRKPDDQIINPPQDFAVWEPERLHNRVLTEWNSCALLLSRTEEKIRSDTSPFARASSPHPHTKKGLVMRHKSRKSLHLDLMEIG
jgi:Fe-S-cluster-containing hydrogenase component 2